MDPRTNQAAELTRGFLERKRRYLWTDSFAVCNLLGLGETKRALELVGDVHHVLGRHRADDERRGWLSGEPDDVAEAHPTRGGLRIGKPLRERKVGEPFDPDMEWERDGQYFHYLTKWMHALDQVARHTGQARYSEWARELGRVAHRAFTQGGRGRRRMIWKASIDLSRALVPSMGQHDPLDGLVTCLELDATARRLGIADGLDLREAATDFSEMLQEMALETSDPLGIGGLLFDAYRLDQLGMRGGLFSDLLAASRVGLRTFLRRNDLGAPAEGRLAFRELGLAIGLHAAPALGDAELARFAPLGDEIEAFWMHPAHRNDPSWKEHADINDVMLATCLAPDGFLRLDHASWNGASGKPSGARHVFE